MSFLKTSLLPMASAVALLGAFADVGRAQTNWSGGAPVYDSDVAKVAADAEAAKEERRKSYGPTVYPKFMEGGERPDIKPAAPPIVYFDKAEEVGSIIVDTAKHRLYYVLPDKKAYEYPISVGRDGFTWSGTERISRIAAWPSWTPPAEMHKRVPGLPITVTGGMKNPQGARALYLGNTIYRIHGTNNERSIGKASSSGCFRMMNQHVIHLSTLAHVGTTVRVVANYSGASESAPISSLFSFGSDDEAPKPAAKVKAKAKPKAPQAQATAKAN